jgi:hypothetical protein
MSTTIVPKDEQDASALAEVLPPPCEWFQWVNVAAQWGDRQEREKVLPRYAKRTMKQVAEGAMKRRATRTDAGE